MEEKSIIRDRKMTDISFLTKNAALEMHQTLKHLTREDRENLLTLLKAFTVMELACAMVDHEMSRDGREYSWKDVQETATRILSGFLPMEEFRDA